MPPDHDVCKKCKRLMQSTRSGICRMCRQNPCAKCGKLVGDRPRLGKVICRPCQAINKARQQSENQSQPSRQ